ncbi:MAG TPA: 1,4-alpha-glucan branching protein GlgB [Mycobacteriales bacterium]|nr:1,4-alpha-glucan branching protein GlgB [Mycobacteriales bacterium]
MVGAASTSELGELDLHLIAEGRHEQLWTVLGAHVVQGGTRFAVWAPNARAVSVIGDWNHWDRTRHAMRRTGDVWQVVVPEATAGMRYKLAVRGADGVWREKADPLARRTEPPPLTASVVAESSYAWGDADWLARRAAAHPHAEPMSTYEVHLGSWRPGLSYRDLADELVAHVRWLGFTHVELMPVMEHPYGGSWGYQVTSYFAPSARFGTPDDLRHLVDRLHQAGIGVILDWVPAHFPRDEWALARFDGTPLYEHADPRRGEHQDWGTLVFDFGRPEVRNFLVANAAYWLEEFHADGLRVDAVASMLYLDYSRKAGEWAPNARGGRENLEAEQFLQELNAVVHRRVPGVTTIAEESTAWPGVTRRTDEGGLGFGFKWNMGWMHDTLDYFAKDPVHRTHHHDQATFSVVYAWSESYVLPLSHDEVVHGKGSLLTKMPGDRWDQRANLRALLGYMWAHPGKKLLFMGAELAQDTEWAEGGSLPWHLLDSHAHRGVADLVRRLNELYRELPALWALDDTPEGFRWVSSDDRGANVLSFLRRGADGSELACVCNFSGSVHRDYPLGLPRVGRWREVINTDASEYGGAGEGNLGEVVATTGGLHGLPGRAQVTLPALSTLWLMSDQNA